MSKQSLREMAHDAGVSEDELIVTVVRASNSMQDAANRLGIQRFAIIKRLEKMGLEVKFVPIVVPVHPKEAQS